MRLTIPAIAAVALIVVAAPAANAQLAKVNVEHDKIRVPVHINKVAVNAHVPVHAKVNAKAKADVKAGVHAPVHAANSSKGRSSSNDKNDKNGKAHKRS